MDSPRPEFVDAVGFHPACVAVGKGPASRITPHFCDAVRSALIANHYPKVAIVAANDAALGSPGHVVIGFTLTDANVAGKPAVLVSAKLSRIDSPGGALYPPPAMALLPQAGKEEMGHVARALLGQLGFSIRA